VLVTDIDLGGVTLPDARTGISTDLGRGPALALLTLIRHRF